MKTSHSNKYAELGKQFLKNVDLLWSELEDSSKDDHEVISKIFPDVMIMVGSHLHLHKAEHTGSGDESYFYTQSFIDGTINRDFVSDVVIPRDTEEFFCQYIWQAYLLSHANAVLPCFWHGGYGQRTFIFSEDDINTIEHLKNRDWTVIASLEELLPKVYVTSENTCRVVCHYWNEWEGMVRETHTYTLQGALIIQVEKQREVLYPYRCGIWF